MTGREENRDEDVVARDDAVVDDDAEAEVVTVTVPKDVYRQLEHLIGESVVQEADVLFEAPAGEAMVVEVKAADAGAAHEMVKALISDAQEDLRSSEQHGKEAELALERVRERLARM